MTFLAPTDDELAAARMRRQAAARVLYRAAMLIGVASAAWFSYQAWEMARSAMLYAASANDSAERAEQSAERAQREAADASDYARKALRAVESQ